MGGRIVSRRGSVSFDTTPRTGGVWHQADRPLPLVDSGPSRDRRVQRCLNGCAGCTPHQINVVVFRTPCLMWVCALTPLTIRVPVRVTKPFRHSERWLDTTSVEPASLGAKRAAHSSSPALSDWNVSCSEARSHCSSAACISRYQRMFVKMLTAERRWRKRTRDCSSSRASWSGAMGGHTAVDMAGS